MDLAHVSGAAYGSPSSNDAEASITETGFPDHRSVGQIGGIAQYGPPHQYGPLAEHALPNERDLPGRIPLSPRTALTLNTLGWDQEVLAYAFPKKYAPRENYQPQHQQYDPVVQYGSLKQSDHSAQRYPPNAHDAPVAQYVPLEQYHHLAQYNHASQYAPVSQYNRLVVVESLQKASGEARNAGAQLVPQNLIAYGNHSTAKKLRSRWNKEDTTMLEQLLAVRPRLSDKEIGEQLGKTPNAIYLKRKRNEGAFGDAHASDKKKKSKRT